MVFSPIRGESLTSPVPARAGWVTNPPTTVRGTCARLDHRTVAGWITGTPPLKLCAARRSAAVRDGSESGHGGCEEEDSLNRRTGTCSGTRERATLQSVLYQANPKHKDPWQAGRKGSLCPRDLDETQRQRLLDESVTQGDKRYATDGTRAFEAQEHEPGKWHGYPVGWKEVPEGIRRTWIEEGTVKRRDLRTFWEGAE
jgi:hypothetical protein